jgi:hypothetical protein
LRHPLLRLCLILSLFCLFGPLAACDPHADDKVAIQSVIDQHAKADAARDGEGLAKLLSRNTFEHYERLMRIALTGTRSDITGLQAADQLEVVRIRVRGKKSQIEKMNGREYAVFATKEGWYDFGEDPNFVEGEELTNFKFAPPDTAYAQPKGFVRSGFRTREKALPFRYTFIHEPDGWKFDETSSYEHWSVLMEQEARSSGMSLADFILTTVSEEADKTVPKDIFDRPMR